MIPWNGDTGSSWKNTSKKLCGLSIRWSTHVALAPPPGGNFRGDGMSGHTIGGSFIGCAGITPCAASFACSSVSTFCACAFKLGQKSSLRPGTCSAGPRHPFCQGTLLAPKTIPDATFFGSCSAPMSSVFVVPVETLVNVSSG